MTNKPAVMGIAMQAHTHTHIHKPTVETVLIETEGEGEVGGWEGRGRGGLWEREAGEKGEGVWSEARGTPDCCFPTCSLSAGARRPTAAAAAAAETQDPRTGRRESPTLTHSHTPSSPDTHILRWPCRHSNTLTLALKLCYRERISFLALSSGVE